MPKIIITIDKQSPQPYSFPLDRNFIKIGRDATNDIVANCGSLSSKHAIIERIKNGYELKDLESTNGIKLDNVLTKKIRLHNYQNIKLGNVSLSFALTEDEIAFIAAETIKENDSSTQIPETPKEIKSDDTKVEKPDKAKPALHRPQPRSVTYEVLDNSNSSIMTIVFIALIAIAFFIGLSLRHKRETGKSLLDVMTQQQANPADKPVIDSAF
jgi:FHA domain